MSYVFYLPEQEPEERRDSTARRASRKRVWHEQQDGSLVRVGRWGWRHRIVVRQREPRYEAAAWLGKTAAGEALQLAMRPWTSVSAAAGVGAAVAIGLLLGALVDLTVTASTVAGLAATGFAVGAMVGFGEGRPLPAVIGGLLGWLVGTLIEGGLTEWTKGPLVEAVGPLLGWCLAAFAGWLVGRVATLLPWPWLMAAAAVATAMTARAVISCLGTSSCTEGVGRIGLIAVKWSAVALIWIYAFIVLLRLRSLRRFEEVSSSWQLLRPFAILYCWWWAPLLTVAALLCLNPGYRLTFTGLMIFIAAMLLPLWISPFFPSFWLDPLPPLFLMMTQDLMPPLSRRAWIISRLSTDSLVLHNEGDRNAYRITCEVMIEGKKFRTRLSHRIPPGGSSRVPISNTQASTLYFHQVHAVLDNSWHSGSPRIHYSSVPSVMESRRDEAHAIIVASRIIELTWREGFCLMRKIRERHSLWDPPAHY